MFLQIDEELVSQLHQNIGSGETVAFIPWGNDFIDNYLAPKVGFRTFNIGGDKNLSAAQTEWPSPMRARGPSLDINIAISSVKMLLEGAADALDRKRDVWVKSVSVRVELGVRRIIKKKNQ